MTWPRNSASDSLHSTYLEAQIMRSLGQLEAGQDGLKSHMDSRFEDLRDSLSGRMDKIDTRVTKLEETKGQSPWWNDMTGREWMVWLLVLLTALGYVKVEILERLVNTLAGAPK